MTFGALKTLRHVVIHGVNRLISNWLISNSLADNVCSVDVIPSIKTDHSAILIEFQGVDAKAKGPGI